MMEQRERDIHSLVQAARDILAYVDDPDERPPDYVTRTLAYRPQKSALRQARDMADRLEGQSRAVRNLKRALEKWADQP